MRKFIITLLFVIIVPMFLYSQDIKVGTGLQPNPSSGGDWGTNALILNTEPIGPISGVTTPNGTIYLAINDTLSTTSGLIVRKSTDGGNTWTTHGNSITNRVNFPRLKMLASSNDSVFVWLQFGLSVYRWNINTNSVKQFDSTNVNDFDVVKSSTGSVYLWITTESGGLRRYGSTDFGWSYITSGYVQAGCKNVKMSFSATSDTMFATYRAYLNPVLEKSIIRVCRYRESAPGTLASAGFQNIVDSNALHTEFDVVAANSTVWIYYTEGSTGGIDIYCRTSTDNGTTYGTQFLAAGNPNVDEYYFSLGISGTSTRYCDFIYYSDSLQSGNPTNSTDKLMYKFTSTPNPGVFTGLTQISQFYPNWSSKNYKPVIIELGGVDVGAAWVGGSVAGRKVYWNRFLLTRTGNNGTQTPATYSLSQNYPNPFNPTTNISFTISKAGFVNIKVFDILGREVATLISQEMKPGNYNYKFDAKNLSSGVYFYKMEVNGFSDVKRMSVIK